MLVPIALARLLILAFPVLGFVVARLLPEAPRKEGEAGEAREPTSAGVRVLGCAAILSILVAPIVVGISLLLLTTVWVVVDGEDGALTYRRYKLIGERARVETQTGRDVEVGTHLDPQRGPENGEIDLVVDASRGTLVIETVEYGFSTSSAPDVVLAPGEWHRGHHVNDVGQPPERMNVRQDTGRGSAVFVHRQR